MPLKANVAQFHIDAEQRWVIHLYYIVCEYDVHVLASRQLHCIFEYFIPFPNRLSSH